MEPLIKVQGLSVIYNAGRSNEKRALDDVSIEIYPKEYIVLFGPSGCGKSTLLYVILGLRKPSLGVFSINGREVSEFTENDLVEHRRNTVGIIFQAYHLIPTLNVVQNVLLPKMFINEAPTERELKAEMLLRRFEIWPQGKKFPSALSGGQQQRAAIVRALMNDPKIILADEPVGNLDSKSAETVMETLKDINEKDGKTIILVTHDQRYLHYAHRAYFMQDGKIVREVINPEKRQFKKITQREQVHEALFRMARTYPHALIGELKAKVLADYLTKELSEYQCELLEKSIRDLLEKKINFEQLYSILDKPIENGGVGLYKQTAQKFIDQIKELLRGAETLRVELRKEIPVSEQLELIMKLRRLLLEDYKGELSYLRAQRIEEGIEQRIKGTWDRKLFQEHLDRPVKDGGVGLKRGTARILAKKLEVILSQS